MTKKKPDTAGARSHPIMLRMSDVELASLEDLEDELVQAAHPALDALGGAATRSDVLRLCIHRGMRALREEVRRGG